MKRNLIIIILLVSVLLLIGCNNNKEITNNTTTAASKSESIADESQSADITEESTTLNTTESTSEEDDREKLGLAGCGSRTYADEDMKRLGVEKKIVVLCRDDYTARLPETITSKLNELLVNKYDCDFVVEFIGFGGNKGYYEKYCEALKDIRELGEQADLIICGIAHHEAGPETDVCDYETYDKLVEEGYLTDITDMLANTEEGKQLYGALYKKLWECVERAGRIYGVAPIMDCYNQQIMVCDKELAESLGIEVKDGFSFYDIGNILESVADKLKEQGLIGCVDVGVYCHLYTLRYTHAAGIYARQNEEGEWVACNPLLDDEVIKLYKTVREYYEKEWFLSGTDKINADRAGKYSSGKYVFEFTTDWRATDFTSQVNKVYSKYKGITEVYVGDVYNVPLTYEENDVTGIAFWSEYKEEALKLLRIFQTEEEIVNLLTYGIEEEHYMYANREVIELVGSFKGGWGENRAVMLNKLLTYPTYLEPDDKETYYEGILESADDGPYVKYGITRNEAISQLENYNKISEIMSEYINGLEYGKYEDVEATIAEANKRLTEAGINEYIDAVNKLFESRRGGNE